MLLAVEKTEGQRKVGKDITIQNRNKEGRE
jgi:hypothetical protein